MTAGREPSVSPRCPVAQGKNTEEGLQDVDQLVARYRHGCLWWVSPWLPVLRLFHPDSLRPVLLASGSPRWGTLEVVGGGHGGHRAVPEGPQGHPEVSPAGGPAVPSPGGHQPNPGGHQKV